MIHGPNIPLLGKVSVSTDSRLTLDKINTALRRKAIELEINLKIHQFYDEARIVKTVSRNRNKVNGLLVSLGTFSNGCYSLRELLKIIKIPTVEIYLKEFPLSTESFSNSLLKDVTLDRIIAPGKEAYLKGINILYKNILSKGLGSSKL